MARMDNYEKAEANMAHALKAAQAALAVLQKAEPLGKTARVLNPMNRLREGLKEACSSLQFCLDEYGKILEGALVEQDRTSVTRNEK